MKFVIERAILLKTLNHVQSIVEKRNTIGAPGTEAIKKVIEINEEYLKNLK